MHTDGGDVYASIAPWGARTSRAQLRPHGFGDLHTDLAVFFSPTIAGLPMTLDRGRVQAGESCVDVPEQVLKSQVPTYVAPLAATVTAVDQDPTAPTPRYYPTNLQYSIRMHSEHYEFLLGHLASISPGLRDKVLAATCARGTCIDVATWQEFGTGAA